MKIKKHYYCLVDTNNKPDFRYIFINRRDAEKKREQIINSPEGETLFVSKHKKDFFIDGVKRDFINPEQQNVEIKKGCLIDLKTRKVSLLGIVTPEYYFEKIIRDTNKSLSTLVKKSIPPITKTEIKKKVVKPEKVIASIVKSKKIKEENTPKTESNIKILRQTEVPKQENNKKFSPTYLAKSEYKSQGILQSESKIPAPKHTKDSKIKLFENISTKLNFSSLRTKLFALNILLLLVTYLAVMLYLNANYTRKTLPTTTIINTGPTNDPGNVDILGEASRRGSLIEDIIIESTKNDNIDDLVLDTLLQFNATTSGQLEDSIKKIVAETPMEQMAPYIAKKDKLVAAFLVGIALKESGFGRHVPVLNGHDCYNYWGYRGKRKRMGSGGHTCFDSPEDAVETVGGRIERLIKSGVDTPQEMVLWKCGSACNKDARAGEWINDVSLYYKKMLHTIENDVESSNKMKVLDEVLG